MDPGSYKDFYNSYKEGIQKRIYNKWSDYDINVDKKIIDDTNNFVPVSTNNKKETGFRIYKNHQNTNVFKEARNIGLQNNRNGEQEKIIGN